ncbi:hypothetical protein ScPMuIL_007927 [Solemya velum]
MKRMTDIQPSTIPGMAECNIRIERTKPDIVDEIKNVLKKILDYCLCCLTCGCYPVRNPSCSASGEEYHMVLLDTEKEAVRSLLQYLDEEDGEQVLMEEHIRALHILAFSDNTELHQSAALYYIEISKKLKYPLTTSLTKPLLALLRSRNTSVHKVATLAVSNFCLNGPDCNKDTLITCGVLDALIKLLGSPSVEVQCNTCGCITSLATNDKYKHLIVKKNGVKPLLHLLKSDDQRVHRNAAGAVLNLTHQQSNHEELVKSGVIPALVEVLHTTDHVVQYYSAASLSNIAVIDKHRTMIVAVGHFDVIKQLIKLLSSKSEKVRCQACSALRNIASDSDNQQLIVQFGALSPLHQIISSGSQDTLSTAVACLRNLSIHKNNEYVILKEEVLESLCKVLTSGTNPEAQEHAAGTMHNLAVGDYRGVLVSENCVEALMFVVLDIESNMALLQEALSALAVLSEEEEVKYKLIEAQDGKFIYRLVCLASLASHPKVQYNSAGTLGQLVLVEIPSSIKKDNKQGIVLYIDSFLKAEDTDFVHMALWTLVQLLKDEMFLNAFQEQGIEPIVAKLEAAESEGCITELANYALTRLRGLDYSTSSSDD